MHHSPLVQLLVTYIHLAINYVNYAPQNNDKVERVPRVAEVVLQG
jgi:hypothetical protein